MYIIDVIRTLNDLSISHQGEGLKVRRDDGLGKSAFM